MDLLESHHRHGVEFHPGEVIERGDRIAVGFGTLQLLYKVFEFDGEHAVHLQDCIDRDDALRRIDAS